MAQITLNSTGVASNGSLVLQSNGTTSAVTIDASQNLGLGGAPSAWGSGTSAIEIKNAGAIWRRTSDNLFVLSANAYYNGTNDKYIANGFASRLFQVDGLFGWDTAVSGTAGNNISFTRSMTLTAAGNLGIGTSTPSVRLDLGSTGNASFFTATNGIDANFSMVFSTDTASLQNTGGTGAIAFRTGGSSERARIDSSGNFLIGKTVSTSTTVGITLSPGGYISVARSGTGAQSHIQFGNGNGIVGEIYTTGSSTVYSTSSDYRLKNTITPMTGALAKVALLKPVTYKWNVDGSNGQGFIAHELAEVVPDCVSGSKDGTRTEQYEISPAVAATFDENGNKLTAGVEAVMGEREVPSYQGIDTSFLVATLTAAIQELNAKFEAYKASHP